MLFGGKKINFLSGKERKFSSHVSSFSLKTSFQKGKYIILFIILLFYQGSENRTGYRIGQITGSEDQWFNWFNWDLTGIYIYEINYML